MTSDYNVMTSLWRLETNEKVKPGGYINIIVTNRLENLIVCINTVILLSFGMG